MTYEVKSLNEECGVFGIWGHPDAAKLTYFGLHSLQHRGQEGQESSPTIRDNYSAIVTWDFYQKSSEILLIWIN